MRNKADSKLGFSTIQYNTTVKQNQDSLTRALGFSTIQYNTTVKLIFRW